DDGIGEIFIAYTQSFTKVNPATYGFDGAVEFPPNNMNCPPWEGKLDLINPFYLGAVYDWEYLVKRSEKYTPPSYTLFRGVCPSWDNEARRPGVGTVMWGSSPDQYRRWLRNALADTVNRFHEASDRLVF